MSAPGNTDRLCAICARRTATVIDNIDGRLIAVCEHCRDCEVPDPPPPPTIRKRALRALARSYGLDIVELAQVLGEDDELGRAKLSAALKRAIRDGLVTYSGGKMNRIYSLVRARSEGARCH